MLSKAQANFQIKCHNHLLSWDLHINQTTYGLQTVISIKTLVLCFVIDVLKGFVIDAINHRISDCYHRINKKFQMNAGKSFLEKDQIFFWKGN